MTEGQEQNVTALNNAQNVTQIGTYKSGQFGKQKVETRIDEEIRHYEKLEALINPFLSGSCNLAKLTQYIDIKAPASDPIISFSGALAIMAAVFGRRYEVEIHPGRGGIRSNLNISLLAVTGRGKENPRTRAKEIFRMINPEIIGGDSATSAGGLIHSLEKYPSRLYMWDEFGEELRKIFDPRAAQHTKAIAETLMKLFTSSNGVIMGPDRAKVRLKKSAEENVAELNKRRDLVEPNAVLYGTSTHAQFFDALRKSSAASGFINRMLIFNTPEIWQKVDRNRDTSKKNDLKSEIVTNLKAIEGLWTSIYNDSKIDIENMSSEPAAVLPVRLDRQAMRHIQHIEDVIMPALRARSPIPAMWIRSVEMTAKISMILALSRSHRDPLISLDNICDAWRIVEFLTSDAIRLFEDCISDNQTEANHKRVLSLIRNAGELSGAQLQQQTRFLKKMERSEILDNLISSGDVYEEKRNVDGSRKTTTFYCKR